MAILGVLASKGTEVTAIAGAVVNVALLILYLVAAWTRFQVSRLVPVMRRAYQLSVPIALIFAASYVWLLIFGDSQWRLLILRVLQIGAICNVWIWPALVRLQAFNLERMTIRRMELERSLDKQHHIVETWLATRDAAEGAEDDPSGQ
jgi:tetrahydromethanopterin S-methyltransferase subunit C